MDIKSVLVEYESATTREIYTNSGILFQDSYLLVTSNVLIPFLTSVDVRQWLSNRKPGILHFDPFPNQNPKVKVVCRENVNESTSLKFRTAEVIASFISNDILESCQTFFKDWAMNFDKTELQVKEALSLFFILKMVEKNPVKLEDGNAEDLKVKQALLEFLRKRCQIDVVVGREIFVESVPFGSRAFLNSFSRGIVSNLVGTNGCFLLTDCPSAPGSEGGIIQIKTNDGVITIGIVISCLNWWKGEWTGLTLGANLQSLLLEMVKSHGDKPFKVDRIRDSSHKSTKKLLLEKINASVVKVISRGQWGSGILIDKEKGIFITNSHVVENDDSVTVQWKDRSFRAEVIFATPDGDVFDLAILKVEPKRFHVLEMEAIEVAGDRVQKGEEVYAVGFSLFPEDLNIGATVTKGNVSLVQKYVIKTTCSVHAGASGGAIIRPKGELVGLIVCNMKLEEGGAIFPRINMAVPMATVFPAIRRYLITEDIGNLKELHCNNVEVVKQWSFTSARL